jgi:hypothetical protein
MRLSKGIALITGMSALALAGTAQAVTMEAGDWTISFNGNVNTFYMVTDAKNDNDVRGGLASTGGSKKQGIRTGLLPASLGVTVATRANGYDVSGTVSYWPGTTSQAGQGGALGNNTVNFRQVFLTVGNENMGTVKLGRDLGVFGGEAILSDMSLLGAGTVSDLTVNGGNTTLGRIGTGYIYSDWKAQIAYTTPSYDGLTVTVAATEAFGAFSTSTTDGSLQGGADLNQPAIEGKIAYDFAEGGASGRIWVGGISQKVAGSAITDHRAQAGEIGAKVTTGGIGLVAYYYSGKGIGTTAQMHQGYSVASDSRRDSDGFYVQGTYTLPNIGTKLGLSYGESNLDANSGDPVELVDKNSSVIVGAYHPLTPNLNLVAEFTRTEAENQAGAKNKENNIALGAILFF